MRHVCGLEGVEGVVGLEDEEEARGIRMYAVTGSEPQSL